VIGTLWIATILELNEKTEEKANATFDYAQSCGTNNYPQTQLPYAVTVPSVRSTYTFYATIIASGIVAIVISFLFVDDIDEEEEENSTSRKKNKLKPNKLAEISNYCIRKKNHIAIKTYFFIKNLL
jgi:hypothetical protein